MAGLSPPIPTCPGEAQHPPTHPPYPTGERCSRVWRLAAHSATPNLYGGGDGSSILFDERDAHVRGDLPHTLPPPTFMG